MKTFSIDIPVMLSTSEAHLLMDASIKEAMGARHFEKCLSRFRQKMGEIKGLNKKYQTMLSTTTLATTIIGD